MKNFLKGIPAKNTVFPHKQKSRSKITFHGIVAVLG